MIAWDPGPQHGEGEPGCRLGATTIFDAYVAAHDLPRHPLNYVGYVSIGCARDDGAPWQGASSAKAAGPEAGRPSAGSTCESLREPALPAMPPGPPVLAGSLTAPTS